MTANDDRVPVHYASEYVHWDLVFDTGMDYLAGNATKYIARWRKKGGRADLEKAQHYVAKLLEVSSRGLPQPRPLPRHVGHVRMCVARFASANGLSYREHLMIERIASWAYVQDLEGILRDFPDFIRVLVDGGSVSGRPLPDPEPVPITEENKHASYSPPD